MQSEPSELRHEAMREEYWRLLQETLATMEEVEQTMKRSARNLAQPPSYRLYLLGSDAAIEAAQSFGASDDTNAREVASSIHDACCDVFDGYELWRGSDRLVARRNDRRGRDPAQVENAMQKHQDAIVDIEDRLQRAFACVRRSRRLVAMCDRLREQRPYKTLIGVHPGSAQPATSCGQRP